MTVVPTSGSQDDARPSRHGRELSREDYRSESKSGGPDSPTSRERDRDRDRERLGYGHSASSSRSASHSRNASSATTPGQPTAAEQYARAHSPQLSQSTPYGHGQPLASSPTPTRRPATSGSSDAAARSASASLSISRSQSPTTGPAVSASAIERSISPVLQYSSSPTSMSTFAAQQAHAQAQTQAQAVSPPARSSSNAATARDAEQSGGLAAPKNNRTNNRRSGFYGVMGLAPQPGGSSLGADVDGTGGSLSPSSNGQNRTDGRRSPSVSDGAGKEREDYFLVPSASSLLGDGNGPQGAFSSGDDSDSNTTASGKTAAGQPLSISRRIAAQQQQKYKQEHQGSAPSESGTSSSLASQQSSAASSVPGSSSDHSTLSAADSSDAPDTAKPGHLSFYDPDVLVFLDAVSDPSPSFSSRRTSKVQPGAAGTSTGQNTSDPSAAEDDLRRTLSPSATPTKPLAPHSLGTGGLSSTSSPVASPKLNQFQSRHLNLVASGHLSTISSKADDGLSPVGSPATPKIDGSEAGDDEEEQEHLSPASTAPLRNRRSFYAQTGGQRSRLSTGTSLAGNQNEDEEEEGERLTKDALKKVRESIRRSRGASVSRGLGLGPPSEAGTDASNGGMTLDVELVELLIKELEQTKNKMKDLQKNYNAIRVSLQRVVKLSRDCQLT